MEIKVAAQTTITTTTTLTRSGGRCSNSKIFTSFTFEWNITTDKDHLLSNAFAFL